MHIKEWLNSNDELEYFSLEKKEFKKIVFSRKNKKFNNDPFVIEEMYERKGVEYNKTENNLSWLENKFSLVKGQVKKQVNNGNLMIKITRRDLEIIKTFLTTMGQRNKSIFERFKNLDGDFLFKERMSNLSIDERFEILYDSIDNHIELLKEKLSQEKITNTPNKKIEQINKKIMKNLSGFLTLSSNTSLKIMVSKNSSFIMTDQFSSGMVDPISSGFLLFFKPITPNICIVEIPENELHRISTKKGINPFEAGKRYISNYFNINYDKFFTFDAKQSYIKKGELNWDDKFQYKINYLSDKETSIINAYLATQASNIIAYKKRQDLHETFEAEKKWKIYRGEDDYKTLE